MCDYSLMHLPNRLAREGEDLVIHRFQTGSKGLVSPAELHKKTASLPRRTFWDAVRDFFTLEEPCPVPAVCIPPLSRLQLHQISPEFQREYEVSSEEEVQFEQLTAAVNTYRDAVCFRNGRKVRLQQLPEGQEVTVLSLGEMESSGEAEPFQLVRTAA